MLWPLELSSLPSTPIQTPSFSPPPPPSFSSSPSSSSFSRPRPSSNLLPTSRFSSDLVSHYLSEIKTSVPRIPQNLRVLRRGVRQSGKLSAVCVWWTDGGESDPECSSVWCLQGQREYKIKESLCVVQYFFFWPCRHCKSYLSLISLVVCLFVALHLYFLGSSSVLFRRDFWKSQDHGGLVANGVSFVGMSDTFWACCVLMVAVICWEKC